MCVSTVKGEWDLIEIPVKICYLAKLETNMNTYGLAARQLRLAR